MTEEVSRVARAVREGLDAMRLRASRWGAPRPRFWIDERTTKSWFECGVAFSLVTRKHHCRVCGRVFCQKCSSHALPPRDDPGVPRNACDVCFASHAAAAEPRGRPPRARRSASPRDPPAFPTRPCPAPRPSASRGRTRRARSLRGPRARPRRGGPGGGAPRTVPSPSPSPTRTNPSLTRTTTTIRRNVRTPTPNGQTRTSGTAHFQTPRRHTSRSGGTRGCFLPRRAAPRVKARRRGMKPRRRRGKRVARD